MPRQESTQPTPDLTRKAIVKLGEDLINTSKFGDQKERLLVFLRKYFGADAHIWLKRPPKSSPEEAPPPNIPFRIDETEPCASFEESKSSYWVITPMLKGANEIGRIILHRSRPFSQTDLDYLSDLGVLSGLAIHATLQSLLHDWRQKQLSLVQSVAARISQITDLNTLTRQITALIQETFNYYYVAVFLIDEETQRLKFKASAGADESDHPDFEKNNHPGFALGEHMIGFVAGTGQELIASDVTLEPRYQEVDALDETLSEAVIPLRVDKEIFGVFDVQSDIKNAFDEDDLLVLRSLADNISIAIESTRLLQNVQRKADQLSAVAEASRAITFILDTDELLNRIVNLIHNRFGFPYVHLFTVDPVRSKITFRAGSGGKSKQYEEAGITYDLNSEKGVIPWVVHNGETRRINDVEKDEQYLDTPFEQEKHGSEMTLPLIFGGEVLGVLDIQSDRKNAFSVDDQQLMETLADNIAIAIRNARLYRSERWRRQVAESLRDIAGLLSDNTALDSVLQAILDELQKNLPCDIGGIWLFTPNPSEAAPPEERELYLAAYKFADDFNSEELGKIKVVPDAWIKNALIEEQPAIRKPVDTIGPLAEKFGMPQDYSAIAAPLYTGDEVLGMLTLLHHEPGRYGNESQKITSAFASYAAIAVENSRLYATSQEQAWIATVLLQVAQATQSQTNLSELVQTIVRLTPMVVGIKGCALFLRDAETEIYSLYASYGLSDPGEAIDINEPIPLPNSPLLAELTLTHEPVLLLDPQEDLQLPQQLEALSDEDTMILMPLIARNEVLGAFLIVNEPEPNSSLNVEKTFSKERLSLIQGIAQQTAVAVENISLLESRQEEAYVSTVLLQAAQAAVSSADLDDVLNSIIHLIPILVGIDSSLIYLKNEGEGLFSTTQATTKNTIDESELIGITYDPGDFPMLDAVYGSNRPLVVPFVEDPLPPDDWDLVLPDESLMDPTPILNSRYPVLMGFPLAVKDKVFGVLLAQDNNVGINRERRFELLWGIAQQASLAIQNDRLTREMLDRQRLEREFQLAREIQQTFLPSQMPPMPGWEMDVRWDTARQVGGDFYDYFLLPDGRLGFVIADVSNKGLAASLYMTVTRTLIRAAVLETTSPARTLERVNDLLLMNSENGLFVTTFYGILSLEDGILTYAIAGHNPPIVLRMAENKVVELEKGGIALGAMEDIHLAERSLKLHPGDCLVLYTDGVTEAFNTADQMYGEKRLLEILENAIGQKPEQLLEILKADLQTFLGDAPLSDDTTVLALYRIRSLTDKNGNS